MWCGAVWGAWGVWCVVCGGAGRVRCGAAAWCGAVRCGAVRCGAVRCGAVRCGVVWCGVVWCGLLWYDVRWVILRYIIPHITMASPCCGVGFMFVVCGAVWCGAGLVPAESTAEPECGTPPHTTTSTPNFFFVKDSPQGQPPRTTNRHQPPTANRRQPPTVIQYCFSGFVSCPCLDHEAESVPINAHWR